jgi:hypothetical protein
VRVLLSLYFNKKLSKAGLNIEELLSIELRETENASLLNMDRFKQMIRSQPKGRKNGTNGSNF